MDKRSAVGNEKHPVRKKELARERKAVNWAPRVPEAGY